MALSHGSYTRQFDSASNATVVPRFYIEPVQNVAASERAGRPIFVDEERVEMLFPGNQLSTSIKVVTDEHRQRWPKEYEAFKSGLEMAVDGTPLEHWPPLKRAQVLELKALNFTTVEQLANMSDNAIQRIGMGGRQLRDLAKAFIDEAAHGALLAQRTADNNKLAEQNASLQQQLDELKAMIGPLHAELMALKNAPSAVQTYIPGMHDPVEVAKQQNQPAMQATVANEASSLANIGAPRRGRKPLPRDENGNIIREDKVA